MSTQWCGKSRRYQDNYLEFMLKYLIGKHLFDFNQTTVTY